MKFGIRLAAAGIAIGMAFAATSASAQDKTACPVGMICASAPQTLVDVMKQTAPAMEMTLDADGLTHFNVSDASYKYGIFLNDCDAKTNCAAIDFVLILAKADFVTPEYVNNFNRRSRMVKAYTTQDGMMRIEYTLSTVGGITPANFRDVKSWWEAQLADYGKYYNETIGNKAS